MSQKSEKCVTNRNKRVKLWSLFIDWGTQFLTPADWIMENDLTRSYGCFLIFLSNDVGLDCFLQPNVLPKLSKITVTCPKSEKKTSRINFDLPKVSKMNISFGWLKVCIMTNLKIWIFSVTEKLESSNFNSR